MWTAAAAAASSSSISLGPSSFTAEISCSTSCRVASCWIRSPFYSQRVSDHSGTRCRNSFLGATQYFWLPSGHENGLSRVSVAADYSDSFPDSSSFVGNNGYHPLEELREHRRVCDIKLTAAEIARTTVEANNRAILMFPGSVHREPHEQVSWADFQYVIDEYGDMFFEIYDEENILQHHEAINPVKLIWLYPKTVRGYINAETTSLGGHLSTITNVLIGMDILQYENRRMDTSDYTISESGFSKDITFHDDYSEFEDSEILHIQVDWGMPNSSSRVHPIYFAKCLTKAVNSEHFKMMDHPSNGVSLWGHLNPAHVDEELYLQRLFNDDGYVSYWKDGDSLTCSSSSSGSHARSTIYRLEIMRIELLSVYGIQSTISVEDFQDAEPDVLVHSMPAIVKRFDEQGIRCSVALRALCKKKGLHVERANLIGVDSLGLDIRVFSGSEVRTHRFPFKVRATSEGTAEKQIQQLLFPRSRRKKHRTYEKPRNADLF